VNRIYVRFVESCASREDTQGIALQWNPEEQNYERISSF
jgi:hypothetical protein